MTLACRRRSRTTGYPPVGPLLHRRFLHRKALDDRILAAQGDALPMLLRGSDKSEVNLFLQDKLSNPHLLDDRDDQGVAPLSRRRNRFDFLTDGDPFHGAAFAREWKFDHLVVLVGRDLDADAPGFHALPINRELLRQTAGGRRVTIRRDWGPGGTARMPRAHCRRFCDHGYPNSPSGGRLPGESVRPAPS
jgi:hypothetical protein